MFTREEYQEIDDLAYRLRYENPEPEPPINKRCEVCDEYVSWCGHTTDEHRRWDSE